MSIFSQVRDYTGDATGHSIDALKSAISRKGGVAQANMFGIYMSQPFINRDLNAIGTSILAGNTDITQPYNDPRDVSFLCESCSLPGRSIATNDYTTWNSNAKKVPYGFINEDVTFTFILTQDYSMKRFFDNWMSNIIDFDTSRAKYLNDFVEDVNIIQMSKNGTPIYNVRLIDAYPITVNAIELSTASENTVQKLTVTLTYKNFKEEGLSDLVTNIGRSLTDNTKTLRNSVKDLF